MKPTQTAIAPYVSSLLALGCWVYSLFRAQVLSITHDEALTYLIFSHRPLSELLTPEVIGMSANNHLLNSLLTQICVSQLGATEIAMRIPALCGAACFFLACVLIAHALFRGFAAVCACIVLLANPYVLDFMPLARGYSLALGLSMLGVWLLLLRVKRINRPGLALSFLSALLFGLAPFANLAYLNLFLAGCCCLLGIEWRHALAAQTAGASHGRIAVIRHVLRTTAVFLPSAAALLLVYWRPVALLRQNKQFFYGGEQGFVRDTVNNLLHNWLYDPACDTWNLIPAAWILLGVVCLCGPACLLLARQRKKLGHFFDAFFPWCWLLCVIPALESLTQHLLLGTRFLLDRTALFFMPLLVLLVLSGLHALSETKLFSQRSILRRSGTLVLAGCAGLFLCHTLLVSTPGVTREWRYCACITQQMEQVAEMAQNAIKSGMLKPPVKVGADYLLQPSVLFFLNKHQLYWIGWYTTETPEGDYPFYLEFAQKARPFLQSGYKAVSPCAASGSAIYLRMRPPGR